MQYYAIDSKLTVSIVDNSSDEGIFVPTQSIRKVLGNICVVYGNESEALSRLIADYLADLESERIYEETGDRVAFCLAPPEPWMMALGGVLLEGVLQGLSWDAVKLAAQHTLDLLTATKATPTPTKSKSKAKKSLGFSVFLELPMLGKLYAAIETRYESYRKLEMTMDEIHESVNHELEGHGNQDSKNKTKKKKKKKKEKKKTATKGKKRGSKNS